MSDPRFASATELQHAIALIDWAQASTGRYPELRWLFAVPNGELRDKRLAAKLKASGVKAGVSDYVLPAARRGFHGLFLELKRIKGRTSPEQILFLADMVRAGYRAVVCEGWMAAKEEIESYLNLERT